MIINPVKNQSEINLQASPVLASVNFDPNKDEAKDFEGLI